jgi:hypothetical protein
MNRMFLLFLSVLGIYLTLAAAGDKAPGPALQAQSSQQCCCRRMSAMGGRGMRMGMGAFAPLPADLAMDTNPIMPPASARSGAPGVHEAVEAGLLLGAQCILHRRAAGSIYRGTSTTRGRWEPIARVPPLVNVRPAGFLLARDFSDA